jgi:hypothetical protein
MDRLLLRLKSRADRQAVHINSCRFFTFSYETFVNMVWFQPQNTLAFRRCSCKPCKHGPI